MTREQLEVARQLGWPWERLADVQAEVTEARHWGELVLEAGTEDDKRLAEWDLQAALERLQLAEDELADVFLLLLSRAIRHAPVALYRLLQPFLHHQPLTTNHTPNT